LLTLLNLPALLIVLEGTIGSVVVQTPRVVIKEALPILKWIFKSPIPSFLSSIEE